MTYENLDKIDRSASSPLLQKVGAWALFSFFALMLIAAAIFVVMIFVPRTELLTVIPFGLRGGDQVLYAFWAALVLGFLSAQALPMKWYKKIIYIVIFFMGSMGVFMMMFMVLEDFQEYRTFGNGQSKIMTERFRVIDVDEGSKRTRYVGSGLIDHNQ